MWVGLTREGFLEEGSQDPGDGDEREAVASGRRQPLQGTRVLRLCLFSEGFPFNEKSRQMSRQIILAMIFLPALRLQRGLELGGTTGLQGQLPTNSSRPCVPAWGPPQNYRSWS